MQAQDPARKPIQCEVCGRKGEAEFQVYDPGPLLQYQTTMRLPYGWRREGDKYYCDEHSKQNANSVELDVTWSRAFRVWWGHLWRILGLGLAGA